MVFQCLIDKKRTVFFGEVINAVVKQGDVVVDLGSGSGVLSLYALKAGASKVYAVEAGIDLYRSLEMTIELNNLADQLILVKGDATSVVLPEKVDVVLCEMIATGLIDELQVQAINNVHNFSKINTKFLPSSMQCLIDLVEVDENFYGHRIKSVQYEYGYADSSERKELKPLSKKICYKTLDFKKPIDELEIEFETEIKILSDGELNGIRFSNTSSFPNNALISETPAYCMPLIYPLKNQKVRKGDCISLKLKYELCKGLHNVVVECEKC